MESVIICSVTDILDTSIRQQDVVFAFSDSVVLLVLSVTEVVSGVEISNAIPKGVSRFLLSLMLLLLIVQGMMVI